jgi:pimeloyl-ACP methyl ester carboxylesterase
MPALLRSAPSRAGLLAVGTVAMLELIGGCNVVRIGERTLTRKLERRGVRSETVLLGDANVHYWEGGEGPPVVLLHGFGASALWQWHEQVGPLARNHRVIVPDLLWFGSSWSKRRDFGIDHQLEIVIALLDHLGIEQADFVGISYGGIVAHELAAMYPERARRLAILDSPGRSYTAGDHTAMLERFAVDDIGQLLVPDKPEDIKVLLELGYYKPPKTPRWVQSQVLDVMYSEFREEKILLLSNLLAQLDSLDDRPGRVTQETLLIWGDNDRVFPLEIGKRLEAEMQGRATLRVIERACHAPNLEHGELVAKWLVEWFGR